MFSWKFQFRTEVLSVWENLSVWVRDQTSHHAFGDAAVAIVGKCFVFTSNSISKTRASSSGQSTSDTQPSLPYLVQPSRKIHFYKDKNVLASLLITTFVQQNTSSWEQLGMVIHTPQSKVSVPTGLRETPGQCIISPHYSRNKHRQGMRADKLYSRLREDLNTFST